MLTAFSRHQTIGGAIQPKTPLMSSVSNASIMHKQAQLGGQLIATQSPMINQQILTSPFPQLINPLSLSGGQTMFLQTSAQPLGSMNMAQSAPTTVQVMPQNVSQTASTGQVVQPVVSTAAATPSTPTSQATTPTPSATTTVKQIKPRPASSTAGTQTPAATTPKTQPVAADSSRSLIKPKPVAAKSSPQQPMNANQTIKPHASMTTQTSQKQSVQTSKPAANSTSSAQHGGAKTDAKPPVHKVSTGTDAISRSTSLLASGGKGDIKNESKQSHRASIGTGTERGVGTLQTKSVGSDNIASSRKVEKRDAFTQEAKPLEALKKHSDSNGSVKREYEMNGRVGKGAREDKKPLVHVIGDYIIEESSNPFPVNGDLSGEYPDMRQPQENGRAFNEIENVNGSPMPVNPSKRKSNADNARCRTCNKAISKVKCYANKNGVRFCSKTCSQKSSKLDLFNPVKSNLNSLSDMDFVSENNSVSSVDTDRQSEGSDASESKRSRKSASSFDSLPPVSSSGSTFAAVITIDSVSGFEV